MLVLASIDWTNAVVVATLVAIATGIPLAIYTGLITAALLDFRSLVNDAVSFMSDSTGSVEFYELLERPVIWPCRYTEKEIAAARYRFVERFGRQRQDDAAIEFTQAFDSYFEILTEHRVLFENAGADLHDPRHENALRKAEESGPYLLAVQDLAPNYLEIFVRPLKNLGRIHERSLRKRSKFEWPPRKEH